MSDEVVMVDAVERKGRGNAVRQCPCGRVSCEVRSDRGSPDSDIPLILCGGRKEGDRTGGCKGVGRRGCGMCFKTAGLLTVVLYRRTASLVIGDPDTHRLSISSVNESHPDSGIYITFGSFFLFVYLSNLLTCSSFV